MQRMIGIALSTAVLGLGGLLATAAPAEADKWRPEGSYNSEGACKNAGNRLLDMASSGVSYYQCRKAGHGQPWVLWVK
ncbi:hypothetical protein [Nocardia fusca]|uniref:Uncharacterized protein n=1 Tax=Nocardia fusca TaxID=941183 RepID=A0ABV3FBD6_9NOCA